MLMFCYVENTEHRDILILPKCNYSEIKWLFHKLELFVLLYFLSILNLKIYYGRATRKIQAAVRV